MPKKLDYEIDFHFVLAMIAILGSAASLFLQFQDASFEHESLTSSMLPIIRNKNEAYNINETLLLNQELDKLEDELEALTL